MPGGESSGNKQVASRALPTMEEDCSEYRGENSLSYLVTEQSSPPKDLKHIFMFE